MTFKGIDITPLLQGLIGLVPILLTFITYKVKNAADAVTKERTTQNTLLKLGALVTTILGRSWDRLAPTIQQTIADGKITEEERAIIELAVKDVLRDFIDEDTLKQYATVLGLPLPGLIAKIASMVLDTFTKAHDPNIQTVSEKVFPIAQFVVEKTQPEPVVG